MPDRYGPEIAQLTADELDRYANQLARCLKALGTSAPIRIRVQEELTEVRAEQDMRAGRGQPAAPKAVLRCRRLDRRRVGTDPARACGEPSPGTARLTGLCADPGTDSRHRRRARRAGDPARLNGAGSFCALAMIIYRLP
jgi:hypothetical protein